VVAVLDMVGGQGTFGELHYLGSPSTLGRVEPCPIPSPSVRHPGLLGFIMPTSEDKAQHGFASLYVAGGFGWCSPGTN
jgi:hypothetical protein